MLRQRVITAVVLLAVLLPALFTPVVWPFALLTLIVVAAAGWEWGRLNGMQALGAIGLGIVVACICALTWLEDPAWVTGGFASWIGCIVWVLGGTWVLKRGPSGWASAPQALRWALGAAMLWLTWLALTQAKVIGVNFLLSIFCLVWVADIAAYFGGRAFGRRKLAPAISPGKSWEGVWSGMAGVLVLAVAWILIDRHFAVDSSSLFSHLQERLGVVGLVLVCIFLAAMSVVGDLFESLVKRSVGAKDSSHLLPGHGGVLDRIDALLPVFPIALTLGGL